LHYYYLVLNDTLERETTMQFTLNHDENVSFPGNPPVDEGCEEEVYLAEDAELDAISRLDGWREWLDSMRM
jgi:hypothetical protein